MKKVNYLNNPLLQINIVQCDEIVYFEVYPLSDVSFYKYQTTSVTDLLEFIDEQVQEVI